MTSRCFSPLVALTASLPLTALAVESAPRQVAALDPVVVTAARQPQRADEAIAAVTVVDREQLDEAGPAATLGEVLARTVGLEHSRSGGPGSDESLFIRGANAGHTLVLVDGVRVGSATTGSTALQMIPLAQIERVEVVRGPVSALYGSDAVGGVVQVFTRRDAAGPTLTAEAGGGTQGTYATQVAHANRVGDFRYQLQAGASGADGINAITSPDSPGYNPDKDGYRNTNLSLGASYRLGAAAEIGGAFFNSRTTYRYDAYQLDAFWNSVNAGTDYRMQRRVAGGHGYLALTPVAGWRTTLRAAQGIDRSESPASQIGDPVSRFDTRQNQYTWQNDIDLPLGTALVGLERLEQVVDSTRDYAEIKRSINSAVLGWQATPGIHALQFNVRGDDNSQFGQHATWLAGYGIRLAPAWRLSASYGTAFKAPTMNELYFPVTPGVGGGNPDLEPETSRNAELALRYRSGPHHASMTAFRNTIRNLIEWTTDPVTWYSAPANLGRARIQGVEFAAGTRLGSWVLGANATYQDPEDLDTGEQLRRRARWHGLASATWLAGPFKAGVEVKAVGPRYDDPHWQTRINQVHMSGYALTNLFADYQVARDWQVFARIDNLFDRQYEVARSTTVTYGTPGFSAFAGVRYSLR